MRSDVDSTSAKIRLNNGIRAATLKSFDSQLKKNNFFFEFMKFFLKIN